MNARTIRRAAERKARKAEAKQLRDQTQTAAAAPVAITDPQPITPEAEPISDAQLTANRANALKSTGPITREGKAISALNHFRHGLTQTDANFILLPCESTADFARHKAAYETEWQPATASETDLVGRLITHSWLRRRALALQNNFLDQNTGLIADEKQFNLYRRYEVQHERAYNKAFSDLLRLRALRIREQNGFESQRRKNEKHEYQIRALQHREKVNWYNEITAQARMTLAQAKLVRQVPLSAVDSTAQAALA